MDHSGDIYSNNNSPVSTARMRSEVSALFLIRNSPSSLVNISFVTAQRLYWSRSFKHNDNINAVFPLPTGPPIPIQN